MTVDRDRGDAPRRLHVTALSGALAHVLTWSNPNICFATSGMVMSEEDEKTKAGSDEPPPPSKPVKDPDDAPDSDRGREIPTKCKSCGVENQRDAHYCKGCGGSMATESEDDDEEDEKASAAAHPPPPERMQAPAKMNADATLAAILGATGEAPLALKTAAIKLRQVRDTVAGVTGKDDTDEMVGALLAVPAKLERGKRAAEDLAKLQAKGDAAERTDLVRRLIKTGAVNRSKIVVDELNDDGTRKLDSSGKPLVRVRRKYVNMDLGILRGLVTDLEGDAPKQRRNPFEPDPERAREVAKTGQHGTRTERIERAKKDPTVLRIYNRPGNELSLDALATAHVNANLDLNGARA